MHELTLYLFGLPHLAEGGSDVKVAVVTTIGVVVAAGLTAFATTFQRDRAVPAPAPAPAPTVPAPVTASPNDSLVQQYITGLESDRARLSAELEALRGKFENLRDACWELHHDPDVLIQQQEQKP